MKPQTNWPKREQNTPILKKISFYEKKALIKASFGMPSTSDDYQFLDREDQVIILRLRTGHNRLNYHMHKKFKKAPSSACCCQQGEQTAEHIFQTCPRHQSLRKEIWPVATSLESKLFGDRVDLMKTTKFMKLTNIKV